MEIRTRKSIEADAEYIGLHATEEAKREMRKLGESDPVKAVKQSFAWSDVCLTILVDGVPAVIYGVQESMLCPAKVWAIGTDLCRKIKMYMVHEGRETVDRWAEQYGRLENWCDEDYTASLRWLRLIGFLVDAPKDGFCHLYATRGD